MSLEESRRTMINLSQEPKKILCNFLIFTMKQIQSQIFFEGTVTAAVTSLRGLIKSLDDKSHEALKTELDKLTKFAENGRFTRMDVEELYQSVCAYLHQTYLREIHPKRLESEDLDKLEEKESES